MSNVTVRVTVVVFPALSFATTIIVFVPDVRVSVLLKLPSFPPVLQGA